MNVSSETRARKMRIRDWVSTLISLPLLHLPIACYSAAKRLGVPDNSRAVQPLIALLKSQNYFLVMDAAESLGRIGDQRAVNPLMRLLTDKHRTLGQKEAAARALETLNWKPSNDVEAMYFAIGLGKWKEAAKYQELSIEPLMKAMLERKVTGYPYPHDFEPAFRSFGDGRAVSQLSQYLEHEDQDARRMACLALENVKTHQAMIALASRLRDQDTSLRFDIIKALGNVGDPAAIDVLTPLFDDASSPSVLVKTIAEALSKLGDHQGIERLFLLLESDSESTSSTVWSLESLLEFHPAVFTLADLDRIQSLGKVCEDGVEMVPVYGDNSSGQIVPTTSEYMVQTGWDSWPTRKEVDCTKLKELARRELQQR